MTEIKTEAGIIDLLVTTNSYGMKNRADNIFYYIVQIGVGGNGSEISRQLAQLLSTSKVPHAYILADPDVISEGNIRNQIFLEEEVGELKAEVLAERYAAAYNNLNIFAYTEGYIESVKDCTKLFDDNYILSLGYDSSHKYLPILIGAIDNAYTRAVIAQMQSLFTECIYIDAGNESVTLPHDRFTRPMSEWTCEEKETYNNSGWSGQVVCGYHHKYTPSKCQPNVVGTFENIKSEANEIKPSEVSCQELLASDPQRTIVNRYSALATLSYLSEIIEEKQISSHITFFHAKQKYQRSQPYVK